MVKGRFIKRMMGGAVAAVNAVCPPGFFCMDTGFVAFVIVVLVTLLVGIYIHTQKPMAITILSGSSGSSGSSNDTGLPIKKQVRFATPLTQEKYVEDINYVTKPDLAEPNVPAIEFREHQREYNRLKPTAPERSYSGPADVRGFIPPPGVPVIPLNIPTQGLPEQFQQVGVLTAPGGTATSATPNRTLLPLFGRKVAVAKERYNYYTRSDGINPVQVPVTFKNRDCEDDNGCDEITSGDTVAVPLLGQTYVATTYRYTLPRYIPYVS
jgi:hypothetical protein